MHPLEFCSFLFNLYRIDVIITHHMKDFFSEINIFKLEDLLLWNNRFFFTFAAIKEEKLA